MNTQAYLAMKTGVFEEHRRFCGRPLVPTKLRTGRAGMVREYTCEKCGTIAQDSLPSISDTHVQWDFSVKWGADFYKEKPQ